MQFERLVRQPFTTLPFPSPKRHEFAQQDRKQGTYMHTQTHSRNCETNNAVLLASIFLRTPSRIWNVHNLHWMVSAQKLSSERYSTSSSDGLHTTDLETITQAKDGGNKANTNNEGKKQARQGPAHVSSRLSLVKSLDTQIRNVMLPLIIPDSQPKQGDRRRARTSWMQKQIRANQRWGGTRG